MSDFQFHAEVQIKALGSLPKLPEGISSSYCSNSSSFHNSFEKLTETFSLKKIFLQKSLLELS